MIVSRNMQADEIITWRQTSEIRIYSATFNVSTWRKDRNFLILVCHTYDIRIHTHITGYIYI